jgi:hypothetical protein
MPSQPTEAARQIIAAAVENGRLVSELADANRRLALALELIDELRGYCRDGWDWKHGKRWDEERAVIEAKPAEVKP